MALLLIVRRILHLIYPWTCNTAHCAGPQLSCKLLAGLRTQHPLRWHPSDISVASAAHCPRLDPQHSQAHRRSVGADCVAGTAIVVQADLPTRAGPRQGAGRQEALDWLRAGAAPRQLLHHGVHVNSCRHWEREAGRGCGAAGASEADSHNVAAPCCSDSIDASSPRGSLCRPSKAYLQGG